MMVKEMSKTFTVALIGADGAGKTTIGRRLEQEQPLPLKYLYMGVNPEASNHLLPTSRLIQAAKRLLGRRKNQGGPPDPRRRRARQARLLPRAASHAKSLLRLGNQLAEEWYRQVLAAYYGRRGYVVLFDRHFFSDYYAHDIAGAARTRTPAQRLHGFVLQRLYPRPDLQILLQAPPEVLYERKGEGSVALLARRQREYWLMASKAAHFAVVDAAQSPDDVYRDVTAVIAGFAARRQVPPAFQPSGAATESLREPAIVSIPRG